MTKRLLILLASLVLTSCTPVDYQALQDAAVARVRQAIADRFASEFGLTIDSVLSTLAGEGGFLHNPLVKILLPPPLGLALAVGQALVDNPEEALLEVLVNRAAEEAIPVLGPVLKETLQALVMDGQLEALLSGEPGAVTNAIRAQSEDRLKAALVPAIGKSLENTGAGKLYATLVAVRAQADQVKEVKETIDEVSALASADEPADLEALFDLIDDEEEPPLADAEEPGELSAVIGETEQPPQIADAVASVENLDDYIAEKAVDGVFKLLADKEQSLRARLEAPPAF